ncbi:hypothetical protein JAAARDRAFT_80108 [Jaapia argillacea MUCL 33604]|uniref:Uncharacterized protein n=1 Tax=Jaapia argillacea MUCL 33604 TaxID=933084 RepID=A0A067PUI7_9AGAM|nr:hypothetical protein JAAARDRAFT_80108 [Jaapia argillacea MUCL 33604]
MSSSTDFDTTVDEDYWRVVSHTTFKLVQANSLVVPPVFAAILYFRKRLTLPRFLRATAVGTFVWGPPIGFFLGWGRLRNVADVGIQDRAYRLRENSSQNHVDQFASYGGAAGALAGGLLLAKYAPLLTSTAAGASFGIAAGILAHLAVVEKQEGPNKMIAEIQSSLPVKEALEEVKDTSPKS